MAGTANRLSIPPEVRREVETQRAAMQTLADTVGTTTISAAYSQSEVQTLRDNVEAALDAVITAFDTVFGEVD